MASQGAAGAASYGSKDELVRGVAQQAGLRGEQVERIIDQIWPALLFRDLSGMSAEIASTAGISVQQVEQVNRLLWQSAIGAIPGGQLSEEQLSRVTGGFNPTPSA
jgi:hypothetical protein